MTSTKLTTADGTMAYTDPNLNPDLINAWSNTTMLAQAAARTKSKDINSDIYVESMNSELSKLGWNILKSGKINYDQQSGMMFSPKDIVLQLLKSYLSADDQTALNNILSAFQRPDAGVSNFLNFWWNKAATNLNNAQFAFGPLTVSNGQPNITVCSYSFDMEASSWRALFVQNDSALLNVKARYLTMQLNMDVYARVKDALMNRVQGKVKDHIAETTLDI